MGTVICTLLGAGILVAGWLLLRREGLSRRLGALLILAVILRLAAGALWFYAMPLWGHGTPAEKAGYVMADAYQRDQAAWKLAQSDKPLLKAFQNNRMADQYGGLLFLSALVYRYVGGGAHQPLYIVILTAAVSSLAILFTWALSRRAWGEKPAWLAACILAVYPEAVLLGSSQMREAFTVTLTAAAFYGMVRYQQERSTTSLAWILVPLLLYLPFSPPFAALLLALLILSGIVMRIPNISNRLHSRRLWIATALLTVLVLIGVWLVLRQFTPEGMVNPLEMLSWWVRKSANLQAYLSKHASGWLQKVFGSTPEWMHLFILLGYGVVQPFLPAALVVGSHAPIWPWIAIWRSTGWTLLLALLVYAPLRAGREKDDGGFARALCLVVWLGILVASFRGGGDLWDNPRYRTAFAALQAALAAWAWFEQRRSNDPWFRRACIAIVAVLAWFIPWYLRRYFAFTWPVVDLFKTLGLGVITAFLIDLWDWARQS